MMDIKDLIKWFIPCFHILLKLKINSKLFFFCFIIYINLTACLADSELVSEVSTKYLVNNSLNNLENMEKGAKNQRDFTEENFHVENSRTFQDTSVGRTFGRPFKKMVAGLIPVIFQIGAASTWAVIAALVGVKTLIVTLVILKILLVAGAAKLGALFANKQNHHQEWSPPHQKEIHLHIHNGHPHEHHEEHYPVSSWSRDYAAQDSKPGYVYEPYRGGPQTISTPFGNYVKIDPTTTTS